MSGKSIYKSEHNEIAKKLKLARIAAGLSQLEVGKKMSKGQSYISKVEAGQLRLDIVELSNFAKFYKKSINYFLPRKTDG